MFFKAVVARIVNGKINARNREKKNADLLDIPPKKHGLFGFRKHFKQRAERPYCYTNNLQDECFRSRYVEIAKSERANDE